MTTVLKLPRSLYHASCTLQLHLVKIYLLSISLCQNMTSHIGHAHIRLTAEEKDATRSTAKVGAVPDTCRVPTSHTINSSLNTN